MRYPGSGRRGDLVSASRRNELRFCPPERTFNAHGKVRDREDALASTRDACAPQSFCDHG